MYYIYIYNPCACIGVVACKINKTVSCVRMRLEACWNSTVMDVMSYKS